MVSPKNKPHHTQNPVLKNQSENVMKIRFKHLAALATLISCSGGMVSAQPDFVKTETQEFLDAMAQNERDPFNTALLEQFIAKHPASRYRAEATMALEKAQILTTGTYKLPAEIAELELDQVVPHEQHIQFFYEGQKILFDMGDGKKVDRKALRSRYQALYAQNDPKYRAEAEYYLGYLDYVEGNYDSALAHFNNLPREAKYQKTVPFYNMQILYAKGDWNNALKEANQFANSSAYDALSQQQKAEIARIKAECMLHSNDVKNGLATFKQYLSMTNEVVPASAYNAGVVAYKVDDIAFAKQCLSRAIEACNKSEDRNKADIRQVHQYSYMLLGQCNLSEKNYNAARMAFEQAAASNADKQIKEDAAYNVATIAHATSFSPWGDDVTLLENFLNTYPKSRHAEKASQYLTEVYMTTKNYEAALNSIDKIKEPNATIINAKQRLLYQYGLQDYVNADYNRAVRHLGKCIELGNLNPTTLAMANYWRGEAFYHQKQYEQAEAHFNTFNAQKPATIDKRDAAAGFYSLGYCYFQEQRFADALEQFDKFVSQTPDKGSDTHVDALIRMGDCHYYNRSFEPAASYYKSAAANAVNQNVAAYALIQEATVFGVQKKFEQKQQVLDELIERFPESVNTDDAWLEKGRTYLLTGDNERAINSFKQAIECKADQSAAPQAAVQLALTYNNMGRSVEAQQVYETVVARYPNSEEAMTAQEDLKTLSNENLVKSLAQKLDSKDYNAVLDAHRQLENVVITPLERQTEQLAAAKAYYGQGNGNGARDLFYAAAQDMRTAPGAEAKFRLASLYFDSNLKEAAEKEASELIASGTPHQYWLAQAIILQSDICQSRGESFIATEYLKSLKNNYHTDDDIQKMIDERLAKLSSTNNNE